MMIQSLSVNLPFLVPVVLYPVTSEISFDNRATFILYLLSYDKGSPSLGDLQSLVSFAVLKNIFINENSIQSDEELMKVHCHSH